MTEPTTTAARTAPPGPTTAPRLVTYQSLWGMDGLPLNDPGRWSIEGKLDRIASAGFDGVALSAGFGGDDEGLADVASLARTSGLRVCLGALPPGPAIDETLARASDLGADFLVLCGNAFPPTVDEGAELVGGWFDLATSTGVTLQLETHRGTITNDLPYTLALLDAVPQIELSADLSHYVVAHGMDDLVFDTDRGRAVARMITRVLERSVSFQGRVASANQVQLQLDFPGSAPWVELFRSWWAEGFASWLGRAVAECPFICELGGAPFPSTGADGREMSDRWAEAQQLRTWAVESFDEALSTTARTAQTLS